MSTMAAGADQLGLERLAIDTLSASMRALNHCVDSIRAVPLDATAAMTGNILQAMGIKEDAGHASVGSVIASRLVALLQGLATAITEGEALEVSSLCFRIHTHVERLCRARARRIRIPPSRARRCAC